MNALDFKKPLGQRAGTCAVIAGVHVGLFLMLTAVRPEFVATIKSEPVHAEFLMEERSLPEWVPPAPEVMPLTITTRLPDAIPVEMSFAPTERAITVAPRPAVASSPPPARSGAGDAPKLISAVEYVRPPSPRYPQMSRRQREQGTVILRVLIDPQGHAARIEIHKSSGYARLDHAAREAVARAAFKPYVENGLVQAALVLIPIEFSLNSLGMRPG